jgi:hypothetical protein
MHGGVLGQGGARGGITTLQRTKLFTGGLPDYIRVDVEMHQPQNL